MKKQMIGKKPKGKCRKSIAQSKKKNIKFNKLAKQGVLGNEAAKKRRKENRIVKRRERREHEEEMQIRREEKKKNEMTGEDMMEMMDEDDYEIFNRKHGKKERPTQQVADYEEQGRVFREYGDGDDEKDLLPVKTENGWMSTRVKVQKGKAEFTLDYKRKQTDDESEEKKGIMETDEEQFSKTTEYEPVLQGEVLEKSVAQILAERKRNLHEQKTKIGCLALNCIKNPTSDLNLQHLISMLFNVDPTMEVTIYKYVLLSVLQVFHDLIPSYRIQENCKDNVMKSTTYIVAKQELKFLAAYRRYLKANENVLEFWKQNPTNYGLSVISEVSIHCLGELLVKHPKFNYSVNIVQALVPFLNHRNDKIRESTQKALAATIRQDKSCYLTLEIIRRIYRLAFNAQFKVKNEMINVFFAIRVNEIKNFDEVEGEKLQSSSTLSHKDKLIRKLTEKYQAKPSRQQKKDKKKMAKIREQMAAVTVNQVKNMENSRHSEIVKKIFGVYFHILKKKARNKLMPVVLEGLAKFAHLINTDFFSDLLTLMNQLLEERTLGIRESLHCIQTVFTILSGQGEALNIDAHLFYNQFYRILMKMNSEIREQNMGTIVKIVEQMLISRRKKVSNAKVLSFSKRLATVSLSLTHNTAIPLLVVLKKLFSMFPASEALLDPSPEGSPGTFLPEIIDPEHANTSSTAVWEMTLLQRHYHPSVRILAGNVLSGVPTRSVPAVFAITKRSTSDLLEAYDKLKFNPVIPHPDAHLKKK